MSRLSDTTAASGALTPLLRDGPFSRPAGAARLNLKLWLLMLPQYLLACYWGWPDLPPATAATLAGSFLGCLILSDNRRRVLGGLDWFVNAWLVSILSAPEALSGWPWEALIRGFICGLITARAGGRRCLTLTGSAAMLTLGLAWLLSRLKWFFSGLQYWPLGFQPASPGLAEVLILAVAFLIFNGGPRTKFAFLGPWLAGLAGLALTVLLEQYTRFTADSALVRDFYTRAVLLLPPALLIAPRLARRRLELALYELLFLALLIFLPRPQPRDLLLGIDPAPFLALLLPAPAPLIRKIFRSGGSPKAAPDGTGLEARLLCGHHGSAARLSRWQGLSSCRLAMAHDDGPLLCPYGCLGLGDCVRACPGGALSLKKGWPEFNHRLCRGCGLCLAACPKGLIIKLDGPSSHGQGQGPKAFIPCASKSSLKRSADYCRFSCLGCGRCAKACPAGAIRRPGPAGAFEIDQELCQTYGPDCGRACAGVCPRRIIETGKL